MQSDLSKLIWSPRILSCLHFFLINVDVCTRSDSVRESAGIISRRMAKKLPQELLNDIMIRSFGATGFSPECRLNCSTLFKWFAFWTFPLLNQNWFWVWHMSPLNRSGPSRSGTKHFSATNELHRVCSCVKPCSQVYRFFFPYKLNYVLDLSSKVGILMLVLLRTPLSSFA